LNLKACRAWIAANFPPVRPMGQWPPVMAAAGASAAP
jgi:hypothetical protein